jgi:hypothetical protein
MYQWDHGTNVARHRWGIARCRALDTRIAEDARTWDTLAAMTLFANPSVCLRKLDTDASQRPIELDLKAHGRTGTLASVAHVRWVHGFLGLSSHGKHATWEAGFSGDEDPRYQGNGESTQRLAKQRPILLVESSRKAVRRDC